MSCVDSGEIVISLMLCACAGAGDNQSITIVSFVGGLEDNSTTTTRREWLPRLGREHEVVRLCREEERVVNLGSNCRVGRLRRDRPLHRPLSGMGRHEASHPRAQAGDWVAVVPPPSLSGLCRAVSDDAAVD
jgi:hypothetical protein